MRWGGVGWDWGRVGTGEGLAKGRVGYGRRVG